MRRKPGYRFRTILSTVFIILLWLSALSYIIWYLFKAVPSAVIQSGETVTAAASSVGDEAFPDMVVPETEGAGSPVLHPEEPDVHDHALLPVTEEPDISDETVTTVQKESDVPLIPETAVQVPEDPCISQEAVSVVQEESAVTPISETAYASEPERIRVPDVPIMFEPWVMEEMDDDTLFLPPVTPVYDDDFFADFFVSGSDTLTIEDGIYYYRLYAEQEYLGDIEVTYSDGIPLFSTAELKMYLGGLITEDAYSRIFDGAPDVCDSAYLTEREVVHEINDEAFTVTLFFTVTDMPERVLSVSSYSAGRDRFSLSGAIPVERQFFSWASSYTLYANFDWMLEPSYWYWYASLSSSNYMTFGPVNLDFYYSLGYRAGNLSFSLSSYRFFFDLPDISTRVSFGNISGFGLGNSHSSVGIQYEKNYAYGNQSAKRSSQQQYVEVTEDSRITIEANGKKIYERTVTPGKYRIRDFTFETGVNDITIIVTPLRVLAETSDPDMVVELSEIYTFSLAYDSQLLAFGDTVYGGSITMGREAVRGSSQAEGGLSLQLLPGYRHVYYFDDLSLSYYQDFGLTESTTLRTEFSAAMRPGNIYMSSADISLVNANRLGTTTYGLNVRLDGTRDVPSVSISVAHRFIMKSKTVSSLSSSLEISNPLLEGRNTGEATLSVNTGGSLGIFRYSLSGLITINTSKLSDPVWRVNGSLSFSPARNVSISTSVSAYMNSAVSPNVQIVGYISASMSLGKTSVSYSSDYFRSNSVSVGTTIGGDGLQVNLSGLTFSDMMKHNLSAAYSHYGSTYSFGARAQAYDRYNRYSASLSLSTAAFFTDGLFAFSRSVRDNFLLIRPEGSLKKASIEVARSTGSNSERLRTFFGTGVYTGLSSRSRNNLVTYISGSDEFADTQTYAYEILTQTRGGYSIRTVIPDVFTVTGLICENGEVRSDFSSPVYECLKDPETGKTYLAENPSLYLFSDQDGRFILSGAESGLYFFDYQYGSDWYAVAFEVGEEDDVRKRVWEFMDFDASSLIAFEKTEDGEIAEGFEFVPAVELLTDYHGFGILEGGMAVDTAGFWNALFPEFDGSGEDWNADTGKAVETVVFSAD
ncbi:MAG: hypothetical protein ACI4NM_07960 [Bullifex sp.]